MGIHIQHGRENQRKNGRQLQITTKTPLISHRKYDFNLSAIVLAPVLSLFKLLFSSFSVVGTDALICRSSVSLQITFLAKALNYFHTLSTCVSSSFSWLLTLLLSNTLVLTSTLLFPSYAFVHTQHKSLSAYKWKWGYNTGVMFIVSLSKRKVLMAFSRH